MSGQRSAHALLLLTLCAAACTTSHGDPDGGPHALADLGPYGLRTSAGPVMPNVDGGFCTVHRGCDCVEALLPDPPAVIHLTGTVIAPTGASNAFVRVTATDAATGAVLADGMTNVAGQYTLAIPTGGMRLWLNLECTAPWLSPLVICSGEQYDEDMDLDIYAWTPSSLSDAYARVGVTAADGAGTASVSAPLCDGPGALDATHIEVETTAVMKYWNDPAPGASDSTPVDWQGEAALFNVAIPPEGTVEYRLVGPEGVLARTRCPTPAGGVSQVGLVPRG